MSKNKGVCARDRPDAARGLPSRSRAAPGRVRSWTRAPCENSVRFHAITRIQYNRAQLTATRCDTARPRGSVCKVHRFRAVSRASGASPAAPTHQTVVSGSKPDLGERPAPSCAELGARRSPVGNATATPHRADTCAEATAVDACRVALPPLLPLPLGW